MSLHRDFDQTRDQLTSDLAITLSSFSDLMKQVDRNGGFSDQPGLDKAQMSYEHFAISPGMVFRVVMTAEPGEEPGR